MTSTRTAGVEPLAPSVAPEPVAPEPPMRRDPSVPDIGRHDMRLAVGIVVVVSVLLIVGAAVGLAIAA